MPPYVLLALASVILVSLVSFAGLFTFSLGEHSLRRVLAILVSLAAGALLGDALLHLLPESIETLGSATKSSFLVLGGFLFFFVIERVLHWHHFHTEAECDEAREHHGALEHGTIRTASNAIQPAGYLVLISDGFHNLLDGLIIGASYLAGIELGIATTIAVILHEIPQEIGDFGVLLHAGFTRGRALFLNFLSAVLAVLGVVISLLLGETSGALTLPLVPIAAGGFIYIAAADLVPELHKTRATGASLAQFLALLLGVGAMTTLLLFE
ncbi:MAG: ZIP family metal transporter [bacterium]|nr:ZIP family metal transporter [bacterium]MDZ4284918.1 ZIP family metal transporter [Patescibacteria group bacterium]